MGETDSNKLTFQNYLVAWLDLVGQRDGFAESTFYSLHEG